MSPKNGLERRGRTSGVGNPPSSAGLNDARKRGRSPSADRRRGWARGELPRTAFPRAPPPEARRAEERGRTPRRTPPIFTRAALPAGHRPAWVPRAKPEAEASASRPRSVSGSEFHPQPRTAARTAAPCAGRAQPRQRRGRGRSGGGYPERREAERGASVAARQRRA
jgi:hypothetical protein